MPVGAGPGGGLLFSTVGRNCAEAGIAFAGGLEAVAGELDSVAGGLERSVRTPTTTATATRVTVTHIHAFPTRLGDGTRRTGLERRLLIVELLSSSAELPHRKTPELTDEFYLPSGATQQIGSVERLVRAAGGAERAT